jgi:pyruvate/2-oxoglutarate dehydrogenase complex dihydrolipoamide acyltransferase (E2) component
MTEPRYLKQAAYARLRGVAKSHVTKLKQTGRLVITPRGLVDVAASDALIAQTGGLRPDVAERLAEQRGAPAVPAVMAPVAPVDAPADSTPADGADHRAADPDAADPDAAAPGAKKPKGSAAADLRRRREEAKRQAKLIELGLLRGALLERADVDHVATDLGVTLRAALDAAVERLAPRLSSAPSAERIAALTRLELSRERRRIDRALVRAARDLRKPGVVVDA